MWLKNFSTKRYECGNALVSTSPMKPSGRVAKIGGTGLGVWEVVRDFVKDEDPTRIKKAFPQLSQAQITAALMYDTRYRDAPKGNGDWEIFNWPPQDIKAHIDFMHRL